MRGASLARQRSWFATILIVGLILAGVWYWSPGLPVLWGPSARADEIAAGHELFEHQWTPNDPLAHGDGLGPVFNARSCVACHFQGGVGGGGELTHNALAFEVLPRPSDQRFLTGSVHNFSVDPSRKESVAILRRKYPAVSNRSATDGSTSQTDPVRTQTLNTTALFGAGWIDLISEKAIAHNFRSRSVHGTVRELGADFTAVTVGKLRVLPDGRIGRFGWRAQAASLADFVATACANEVGLGTPTTKQARPLMLSGDADGTPDLDKKQVRSLVAFVSTLPRPVEMPPSDASGRATAERGKKLFGSVGCAVCHVPDLGGVKGVYSDFLLYNLDDPPPPSGGGQYGPPPPPELPRPSDEPEPGEWKTSPLWGVADSAPYFHDGASSNLQAAVLRHRGDARSVTERFQSLPTGDQEAIIRFLRTLKAPPDASPVSDLSVTKLVKR